jgi:hypothetical protein
MTTNNPTSPEHATTDFTVGEEAIRTAKERLNTSPREELARVLYPEVFQAADSDIAFWREPSESGYSETGWVLFRRCRRTLEAVQVAYERLDAATPLLSEPVKAASPEGEELTEDMLLAGAGVWLGGTVHALSDEWRERIRLTWEAMIAARSPAGERADVVASQDREAVARIIGETSVNMNMSIAMIIVDGSPSTDVQEVLLDAADAILALQSASAADQLAEPVAWRTRGMYGNDNWAPWEMVSTAKADRWRRDPSFTNGRRQIEPLFAAADHLDSPKSVGAEIEGNRPQTLTPQGVDPGAEPTRKSVSDSPQQSQGGAS